MRIEWTLFAMNDREAIFDYIEPDSPRAAALVMTVLNPTWNC